MKNFSINLSIKNFVLFKKKIFTFKLPEERTIDIGNEIVLKKLRF